MTEIRIFSRRTVLADDCRPCEIVVRDGQIAAVDHVAQPSAAAYDWGDDFLIPGLVDIHTDNLEKHYQPRPGATWDGVGAVMAHDGQCASAGITTVFDSLSLHGNRNGLDRGGAVQPMIDAIGVADDEGLLRIDHALHLRCEVTNPELLERLAPFAESPRLKLLSLMDHRPGQRQLHRKAPVAATAMDGEAHIIAPVDDAVLSANRAAVAARARAQGIALAAHDDATADHVEEALAHGCSIAEFPVTALAAQQSRDAGMHIVMGGPNFVRGASNSGNLSARETASLGLLDILASDYIPLSMLRSAFMLTEAPFGWPVHRAIDTVTGAPARSVGFGDRGKVAAGLRADIVRVRHRSGGWPQPVEVWSKGRRVA
jgi:alpha-D-ribose 1-methylphosphonate 5-triphosphate diphosphatase